LKVVSKRLGHSTAKLTIDTYMHVLEGMDREAAESFDGLFVEKSSDEG
jgi:integrase